MLCSHAGCVPVTLNARQSCHTYVRACWLHIAFLARAVGTPSDAALWGSTSVQTASFLSVPSLPLDLQTPCLPVLQPCTVRRGVMSVYAAGSAHRKLAAPPRAIAQLYAAAAGLPFVLSSGAIAATGAGC